MSYNDPFGFVGAIKIPKDKKTVDKVHRILFKKKEIKRKCEICGLTEADSSGVCSKCGLPYTKGEFLRGLNQTIQLRRMLDSTMKSVNRKSREAGYGNIMKTVRIRK